jgi:Tfp pilus assembly protein FimT
MLVRRFQGPRRPGQADRVLSETKRGRVMDIRGRYNCDRFCWAVASVEMLIVIVTLAILASIVVPMAAQAESTRLLGAARLMVIDIEFAQLQSISRPDDPCLLRIDQDSNRYWIARVSDADTPIIDPGSLEPLLGQFGAGRGAAFSGVSIAGYSLDGDTELRFNGVGIPDQSADATIDLAGDADRMRITIAAGSGKVAAALRSS